MVLRFCCLSNTDHRRRGKDRRTREESGELTLASPLDGALCRLVCWTRRSCLRHVLRQPRVGEPCANGNGIGSIHVPALVGTSCASVLALQWKTCRHGEERAEWELLRRISPAREPLDGRVPLRQKNFKINELDPTPLQSLRRRTSSSSIGSHFRTRRRKTLVLTRRPAV